MNKKNQYHNFSPKLSMWYLESLKEKSMLFFITQVLKNIKNKGINYDYAIYPKRFYKTVEVLEKKKKYDYCFIGALKTDEETYKNRMWLLNFIKINFTIDSYLQFTDSKTKSSHVKMGSFDYTNDISGIVPKELPKNERNKFDINYFKTLSQSQFTICPVGDKPYSMRFYEALMCHSIPIVESYRHTFRSKAESKLSYKYYLKDEKHIYRDDWVKHNYELFLKYHTFDQLK